MKSWRINRRTMLRGAGVAMSLPFLEGVSWGRGETPAPPKRFCGILFPYGCSGFGANGVGTDFELSDVLSPLQSFRDHLTIFKGLEHADKFRAKVTPHGSGDSFLTGTGVGALNIKNTVSVDQLLAHHLGDETRYASYVFGTDGGVGVVGTSKTLSYDMKGEPIPAQNDPRRIFNQLFLTEDQRHKIQKMRRDKSVLDKVLEDSRSLRNRLGNQDQVKLDEYLQSVRHLERRIQRQQEWIDKPLPKVDPSRLNLEPSDPREYMRVMYDLMTLLMQTDMARHGTFQLGSQSNNGDRPKSEYWPQALGLSKGWHGFSHNGNEMLDKMTKILVEEYSYFMKRLGEIQESNGTLLDNTAIVFGSSTRYGHKNRDYPMLIAGGKNMGLRHGQYLNLEQKKGEAKPPLANAYVTLLQQCGLEVKSFADSTGVMSELLV
ncbi:MAG: DUF1552 domain-containing protein [Planctomycetales bacterium]